MSKSITQDMAYRQSLMKYAQKYGVGRASRKYNRARSYIYFWKARWDGTEQSLACHSRRPESLFRVLRRLGLSGVAQKKPSCQPRPYEQITCPGQRLQVDVKILPRACITDPRLRLFQYTAIDEFSRLRFLWAYEEQSAYSSADFLERLVKWYKRPGITVECVQTDNGFEFANRFSSSKRDLPSMFDNLTNHTFRRHDKCVWGSVSFASLF